jgi:prolipoprotein diacylglyceryltransferase
MQQVLIELPFLHVPIFGFGAMLCIAFLSATWVAARRARSEGVAPEYIQDAAMWLIVGGLLGARIVYLVVEQHPTGIADFLWQLPRIWDGGIVLYGAVPGGALAYAVFYRVFARRYRFPTLQIADIIAPSIALGIAFGRLGCFLNGCCYGQVACAECAAYAVHFPLSAPPRYALVPAGYQTAAGFTYAADQPPGAVRVGRVEPDSPADRAGLKPGDLIEAVDGDPLSSIGSSQAASDDPPTERLSTHLDVGWKRGRNELTLTVREATATETHDITFAPRSLGLHPTQLYETVSMALLFLLLIALYPVRQRQGMVMAVLMMGYAAHRALNELLRSDPRPVGLERYTSYLLFAAGLGLAVYVWMRGKKVPLALTEPKTAEHREVIAAGATGAA